MSRPKLAAITPRNSPAAKSGATTEAAVPERSSRFRRKGSSVEASRTITSRWCNIRSISGASVRMVNGSTEPGSGGSGSSRSPAVGVW